MAAVDVAISWAGGTTVGGTTGGCMTVGGTTGGAGDRGEDRRVTSVHEDVVEGSPSGGGGVGGSPPLGGVASVEAGPAVPRWRRPQPDVIRRR